MKLADGDERPRRSNSDCEGRDRRPVRTIRCSAEEARLWQGREVDSGPLGKYDLAAADCERAQAEQPAAGHLMVAGGSGVVAIVLCASRFCHAVVNRIGMGEAIDCILAMTESEHGRRRHEAERRERGKSDREPVAEPGAERGQHWVSLVPRDSSLVPQGAGCKAHG